MKDGFSFTSWRAGEMAFCKRSWKLELIEKNDPNWRDLSDDLQM